MLADNSMGAIINKKSNNKILRVCVGLTDSIFSELITRKNMKTMKFIDRITRQTFREIEKIKAICDTVIKTTN